MQSEPEKWTKLGAVIYLKGCEPFKSQPFVSDFRKRWPGVSLVGEGREGNRAYFGIGDCHFAVEFRAARVPQPATDAVLRMTAQWPDAERELAPHQTHLAVSASVDHGNALNLACEFTRVLAALATVSDSIGVCWLNGSVLCTRDEFVGIAAEMLGLGTPPLMLWIATHWKSEGQLIHTKGMSQFAAAELFLAQQPGSSLEMVEYLFDLAHYVLTSGNELVEGETIDGPKGVFRIVSLDGSDSGKKGTMLVPMKVN
jgi:hypothetical protein